MGSYTIAVIPGDGVGPEVSDAAVRVLETAAATLGFTVEIEHLGETDAASAVAHAVTGTLAAGEFRTADIGGTSRTDEVASEVVLRVWETAGEADHDR